MKEKFIFLLVFSISLLACNRDEEEANQISAEALEDNAEFESAFSSLENVIVDGSDKESDNAVYQNRNCASITVTPSWASGTFPKTITFDFGDTNCLGIDGNYRRGKLIIEISGSYRDSGTVITSRLENYFQNDNKIEGTKTKTNMGKNSQGNFVFSVSIENARFLSVNGYSTSWNSNRSVEWIGGESTVFNLFDDEYSILGSASGVTGSGKNYSLTITKELIVQLNCKWIKSGTISIKPEDFDARMVDYGDGACDRVAIYTVNGKEYQFTMR